MAPQGDAIGLDDPHGAPPASAAEALQLLDRAHDRWDEHLALATEESLGEQIGEVGGGYADRSGARTSCTCWTSSSTTEPRSRPS